MLKPKICGCIFIFSLYWSAFLRAAQETDPSEVNVLRAVKSSLNDHKNHLYNWNRGDPCTSNWTGVFCFDSPGKDGFFHLQELQLLNMNLSGNLAPELGKLTQLEILDFMWNELTGNIPKEIGNITSLKLLLLNGNKLSGSLPEELGYFPNLRRLQVDENQISGPIPKSFANLTSLLHLHLNNNSISGEIPSELSTVSKLIHLLLDNNNLSGNLPSKLSQLPELRILQLDNNNFNGSEIPSSYGNFSSLIKLSLRNCNLVGPLPDFSRINYLSYLDLSVNHLTGPIPPYKLSDNITTIDLSTNHFNESIPDSFSGLPALQTLSLANNTLTGSILASIWENKTFSAKAKLLIDLQDNLLSEVEGELNPPVNVTLRLGGNPVCSSANIGRFCKIKNQEDVQPQNPSNLNCQAAACPTDNYFDYVPEASICFCAAPIRIGYRLKSPSISYFPPYADQFVTYITSSLGLELYQLSIDSVSWEGPRLRMHLKIYPVLSNGSSHLLNTTEVERIRHQFASWHFPQNDLFGPYELLNFTLLGPYSTILPQLQKAGVDKGILVAIALGAVVGALFVCAVITFVIFRRTRHLHSFSRRNLSASRISMKIEGVKAFRFREMALATDNFNFSSQVGQGGYGRVYKGILSDGSIVAIKRAEEGSLQGQKEFLTEIGLLSRLHHRNLVSLVGFCDEEGEQMLVYEFMPNGTLRQWLSGKGKEYLDFGMRVRIGLGSAKGILYLHTEANPPVFHRDIKATNILLDSRLTAKVADFGLSRLAPVLDDEGCVPDHVSTVVKGTPGYLDPEYFLTHKLTDKSDVYSFGVVLLELLTGMPPISHGKNIVREVNTAQETGMMFSIIDTKMGSYPSECMHKFAGLAITCCHDQPDYRPSMLDVVRELESILKMMPQTTDMSLFSDTASTFSITDTSATSSSYVSSKQHNVSIASSTLTGRGSESSNALISGVVPSITPR